MYLLRQEPRSINMPSKTRGGRLLGRCHAALGDHGLAVAAMDAALETSKTGALLFSEALTVRTRALVGQGASADGSSTQSAGKYWPEHTTKERVLEVMGRMGGERQLLEKLLLHELP